MSIITNTYGALLLGSLTATFLSGMNMLQTVLYFRLFPEDSIIIKASVSVVWSLDIIHTAFTWVGLWTYFIVHIGQIDKIDEMQTPELIPGTVVLTSVITFIVHMFYIQRIFRFSHRKFWISAPILLLALARVGSSMETIFELYHAKRFSVFVATQYQCVLTLGIVSAVTDVAIMIASFVLLKSSRQNSISLNNVIDQLILYTLEMGSLTAIMAVVTVIAGLAQRRTLIFLALYLCFAKIYAISFTGSLNTRYYLRQRQESQIGQAWKLNQGLKHSASQQLLHKSSEIPLQDLRVDVTRSIQYDDKSAQ